MALFSLARVFVLTVLGNLAAVLVGGAAYPEPFSLVMDPLSWLGKLETAQGLPNSPLFFLTSFTLLTDALVWRHGISLLKDFQFGRRWDVRALGWMVTAGFIIMAFPCDKFILLHSIGGALLVGGLWAFTTVSLWYTRKRGFLGRKAFVWRQILLHAAALFCGINFVWDTPLKGFSQKPLVLAILVNTALCLHARFKASVPGELGRSAG